MQDLHNAFTMRELGGTFGSGRLVVVAIPVALVGALTMGGLLDPTLPTGTPSTWVLPPGSVGAFTTTFTSAHSGYWSYASASDKGKALVVWHPV